MNYFKKTLIADIETTKENKNLVVASAVLVVPVLLSNVYELSLREKVKNSERADQIGMTLTAVGTITSLASLIPSIMYQRRFKEVFNSL